MAVQRQLLHSHSQSVGQLFSYLLDVPGMTQASTFSRCHSGLLHEAELAQWESLHSLFACLFFQRKISSILYFLTLYSECEEGGLRSQSPVFC